MTKATSPSADHSAAPPSLGELPDLGAEAFAAVAEAACAGTPFSGQTSSPSQLAAAADSTSLTAPAGEAVRRSLPRTYDVVVRNTKAFKEAVAQTLAELAHKGVTLAPSSVEDFIENNINTVVERLGIQVRSAWRYFDAKATADHLAQSVASYEESSNEKGVGQAPMPPLDNPELALVLAGVPDSLAQTGGDLYAVIINVAVNAWMAGHIHGEDGCAGCDGSRGPAGHDWEARMRTISEMQPNISKWFDRDVWTRAVNDAGYTVTRR
ncbi:hypothetical protein AB0E67_35025 [Streptomyces sp. NPDC032161]|uniref:hypothetical protein n=1 Tax=unclassified Streptomyces TaxID=2593676 RepID=UPI0033E5230D